MKLQALKVFVIGASGSLGRAIAEQEAARGSSLVLIATDLRDLVPMKLDLELRFAVGVDVFAIDFSTSGASGTVGQDGDRYYFPIGATMDSDSPATKSKNIEQIFQINFLSIAGVVGNLLSCPRKKKVDIIGFGSIAETRGRSTNVYYSASKRGLTSLFESLWHAARTENIRPFLFQIGYMKSQLSFGKKMLFPASESRAIAASVLKILDSKDAGIFYLPRYWLLVCFILKRVPWIIYQKLNF